MQPVNDLKCAYCGVEFPTGYGHECSYENLRESVQYLERQLAKLDFDYQQDIANSDAAKRSYKKQRDTLKVENTRLNDLLKDAESEKQIALEALKIVDEITEKMLMDCDHASALGAYFNPSAEDLASDIGSVVLEALEKMNEDVTEGQERVIERKYNKMFEALKWIEECSVDYQSINKAKIALGVNS